MAKEVKWPGWDIVRLIGKGSFGNVYEIQRDVFGTIEKAALKVITIPQNDSDVEDLMNDGYDAESITQHYQSYLMDIVREYSLMAELKGNSNIVDCDDLQYIAHEDGFGWDIYIKMELLTPLNRALGKDITVSQAVQLGIDICNALILCKKHNIVHRDIKPQNIFVSRYGHYKLGDFGIAKVADRTTSGTKTGTFKYMAPEVYNNQPYGSASDIYSLGIVLYWMLNERRTPFLPLPPSVPTASIEEDARRRRFQGEEIPKPLHGSEELKRIVCKACAFDPAERYHSAEDMLHDLKLLFEESEDDATVCDATVCDATEVQLKTGTKKNYFSNQNKGGSDTERKEIEEQLGTEEKTNAENEQKDLHLETKSEIKPTSPEKKESDLNNSSETQMVDNAEKETGTAEQDEDSKQEKDVSKSGRIRNGIGGIRNKKLVRNIIIVIIIAVIGYFVVSSPLFGSSEAEVENYPTERTMMSDVAKILRDENVAGRVTELFIVDENENERYQTYTAECDVSVNVEGAVESYKVILIYENDNSTWVLSDLSHLD